MAVPFRTGSRVWRGLDPIELRDSTGGRPRNKVLVPVASPGHVPALIVAAAALARTSHAEVLVLHVTWVPPQLPLSAAERFRADARPIVQAMHRMREHILDVPVRLATTAGRRVDDVVIAATGRDDVSSVVLEWPVDDRDGRPRCPLDVHRIVRNAGCDCLVLRSCPRETTVRKLVLAVRPFNDDVHTITPAASLAGHHAADLELWSVLPRGVDRRTEVAARMWLARLQGDLLEAGVHHRRLRRRLVRDDDPAEAIGARASARDLIILGTPLPLPFGLRTVLRRLPRGFRHLEQPAAIYISRSGRTLQAKLADLFRRRHDSGRG